MDASRAQVSHLVIGLLLLITVGIWIGVDWLMGKVKNILLGLLEVILLLGD